MSFLSSPQETARVSVTGEKVKPVQGDTCSARLRIFLLALQSQKLTRPLSQAVPRREGRSGLYRTPVTFSPWHFGAVMGAET